MSFLVSFVLVFKRSLYGRQVDKIVEVLYTTWQSKPMRVMYFQGLPLGLVISWNSFPHHIIDRHASRLPYISSLPSISTSNYGLILSSWLILREEGLPATTPRYRYQDVEQSLRCLQLESKRYREGRQPSCVIFDQIDERTLQEYINNESADSLLQHSFMTYYFSSQILILRISSNLHEIPHRNFSGIFGIWYMFQENPLAPTGCATVEGFTRCKNLNSSWQPRDRLPGGDIKGLKVVLESGWSVEWGRIKQDILFWQ